MANVLSPPITDITGQLILSKLNSIKRNMHLPLGNGFEVDLQKRINVIPEVYSGLGAPTKLLGKTGDIYVRYKWISQDEEAQYVADINTIYAKMPVGEIAEDDPDYNPWVECFSDIVVSSGTEEPLPEEGHNGDIYLMYIEIYDEETGETTIEVIRFYQKIEDQWAYFAAGVPRDEFLREIHKATHKSLVLYNTENIVLASQTANTYKKFLVFEQDFVMENRSPLDIDFEFLMSVVCDPYTDNGSLLSIEGDTQVRVIYAIDYTDATYSPEQVLEDGPNVLSFHYPISVIEAQVHNFRIYFEVMNGTISIAKRGIIGNMSGTGIDATGFSGVMVGKDSMSALIFTNTLFKTYSESANDPDLISYVGDNGSDSIGKLSFFGMFAGLSDSVTHEEEEPEEEEEEND